MKKSDGSYIRILHQASIVQMDESGGLIRTLGVHTDITHLKREGRPEVVNEAASISAEMAVRLEDAFGISAGFWLDMQKSYDIWKIRHSGRVHSIYRIQNNEIGQAS